MNKPQTGIRFRSEMLGCSHIQRLAEYVAAEYGLPRVDRKHVRRMYAQATPIPISLENENGQLWVDKYYLAYRLPDGVTHYVYLSRTHIREEYRNYQAAAASREQRFAMPIAACNLIHEDEIPDEKPVQMDFFTDYEAVEREKQAAMAAEETERKLQQATLAIQDRFRKTRCSRA